MIELHTPSVIRSNLLIVGFSGYSKSNYLIRLGHAVKDLGFSHFIVLQVVRHH